MLCWWVFLIVFKNTQESFFLFGLALMKDIPCPVIDYNLQAWSYKTLHKATFIEVDLNTSLFSALIIVGVIAYSVSSIFSKSSKGVNLPASSSSWVSVKLDARALEVVLIIGLFLRTVGLFLRTVVVQNSINFFTDGWQLERSARFVQVLNIGPEGDQLCSFRNETALNQFPEIKIHN